MRRDPSTVVDPSNPREEARGRPIGVVLAGGSSRRLGRDKTLLRLDGLTLPERALDLLSGACSRVAIADGGRALIPGSLSLADAAVDGPAGGILGAAERFRGSSLLVLACDIPRVPRSLIDDLARPGAADWVVPRWRRGLEPLCALYGPRALTRLRALAEAGDPALHRLTTSTDLRIRWIERGRLERHGRPEEIFLNLNRPQDLTRLDLGAG